jgi:hypothetical protein
MKQKKKRQNSLKVFKASKSLLTLHSISQSNKHVGFNYGESGTGKDCQKIMKIVPEKH